LQPALRTRTEPTPRNQHQPLHAFPPGFRPVSAFPLSAFALLPPRPSSVRSAIFVEPRPKKYFQAPSGAASPDCKPRKKVAEFSPNQNKAGEVNHEILEIPEREAKAKGRQDFLVRTWMPLFPGSFRVFRGLKVFAKKSARPSTRLAHCSKKKRRAVDHEWPGSTRISPSSWQPTSLSRRSCFGEGGRRP